METMDFGKESLALHAANRGKWEVRNRIPLNTHLDLSLAYTPGVAAVSSEIAAHPEKVWELTPRGNTVAVVSNGTAVLGLGDIGSQGAIPVMEGKSILFKQFADIDAVPIVTDLRDPQDLIRFVRAIAPSFGGINLEDIKAPECFQVEQALQDLGIPVFHDDQHGTAIVLLAGLINAARATGRKMTELNVVINGAGAAGSAIARLLRCVGHDPTICEPVKSLIICDSKGIIAAGRKDLNREKEALLSFSNRENMTGTIHDALRGADVFIGVSKGNLLTEEDIRRMAPNPIIFPMANPVPEIMPEVALKAGAAVVGTGRSDYPNQVNNLLVFPGIFRGALDAGAAVITPGMKIAAAHALARYMANPTPDNILPDALDSRVAPLVAAAVKLRAISEGVANTRKN